MQCGHFSSKMRKYIPELYQQPSPSLIGSYPIINHFLSLPVNTSHHFPSTFLIVSDNYRDQSGLSTMQYGQYKKEQAKLMSDSTCFCLPLRYDDLRMNNQATA